MCREKKGWQKAWKQSSERNTWTADSSNHQLLMKSPHPSSNLTSSFKRQAKCIKGDPFRSCIKIQKVKKLWSIHWQWVKVKEKGGNRNLQRNNWQADIVTENSSPRAEISILDIVPVEECVSHVAKRRLYGHQGFSYTTIFSLNTTQLI